MFVGCEVEHRNLFKFRDKWARKWYFSCWKLDNIFFPLCILRGGRSQAWCRPPIGAEVPGQRLSLVRTRSPGPSPAASRPPSLGCQVHRGRPRARCGRPLSGLSTYWPLRILLCSDWSDPVLAITSLPCHSWDLDTRAWPELLWSWHQGRVRSLTYLAADWSVNPWPGSDWLNVSHLRAFYRILELADTREPGGGLSCRTVEHPGKPEWDIQAWNVNTAGSECGDHEGGHCDEWWPVWVSSHEERVLIPDGVRSDHNNSGPGCLPQPGLGEWRALIGGERPGRALIGAEWPERGRRLGSWSPGLRAGLPSGRGWTRGYNFSPRSGILGDSHTESRPDPEGHRLPSSESRVRVITSRPRSSGTSRPQPRPETASILQLPFRNTNPLRVFVVPKIISSSNPCSQLLFITHTKINQRLWLPPIISHTHTKNTASLTWQFCSPQIR